MLEYIPLVTVWLLFIYIQLIMSNINFCTFFNQDFVVLCSSVTHLQGALAAHAINKNNQYYANKLKILLLVFYI